LSNRLRFVLIVGLGLFAVCLLANTFNVPFERDEGHYAYGAWIMTQGLVPYVDTLEQKPPLIYFPYFLAGLINPDAYWPPRLVAGLFLFFTLWLLWLTVKKEYGERAGWLTVYFALPMILFPRLCPFAANSERFLILPLIGTLAIYVLNRENSNRWHWFWAGATAAAAVLFKQIALPMVAFIIIYWLFEERARRKDKGEAWRKFAWAVAGGALISAVTLGYFFLRGGFPGFWEGTVVYNRYYAMSYGGVTFFWLASFLKMFLANWPLLFVLLFWFVLKRPPRWIFYITLLIIGWLPFYNTPYGHYYIILMPVWAIISAVALDSFLACVKRPALMIIIPALVIGSMLWPVAGYYFMPGPRIVTALYSPANPFLEAPLAAKRAAALTAPGDYLFVAGSESEIYFYAKRLCPTRLVGMYGLMMDSPQAADYQREMIAELERRQPKVIIFVRSPLSWLILPTSPRLINRYLFKLLKEKYLLVGGSLRQGSKVEWVEPLRQDEIGKCTLLLCLRKK